MDFGAPPIKILLLWPFIFHLKNNKDWSTWQLKRTTFRLIPVFCHWANGQSRFILWDEQSNAVRLKRELYGMVSGRSRSFSYKQNIKKIKHKFASLFQREASLLFFFFKETAKKSWRAWNSTIKRIVCIIKQNFTVIFLNRKAPLTSTVG